MLTQIAPIAVFPDYQLSLQSSPELFSGRHFVSSQTSLKISVSFQGAPDHIVGDVLQYRRNKKRINSENVWKTPPKIQVDVYDSLQRARAISSQVLEYGLMFNLEEVRQDQKKRTVSVLLWKNDHVRSLSPEKTWLCVNNPAWA